MTILTIPAGKEMMRIFDIEWWNEIFQSLARNKRRSIFTAMGVVWGTFMLVLLLGTGIGLSGIITGEMGNTASNTTFMFPQQTSIPYKGMKSGRWWHMRYSDVEQLRKLPEVRLAGALGPTRGLKLVFNSVTHDSYTTAYDLDFQTIDGIKAVEGRLLNRIDMTRRRKVCLVPERMAARLDYGRPVTGKTVQIGNTCFTIVGTYRKTNQMLYMTDPDRTVIIPYTTDNYIFSGGSLYVSTIAVTADKDADISEIEGRCKKVISENHLVSPDDDKALFSFNARRMMDKIQGLFSGVIFLTWFVGAGTLLAGIIGISNIMLIIVRERRQEIGVRRALGARPGEIISQVIAESTVLALTAGICGMVAAIAIQGVMDKVLLPVILQNINIGGPVSDYTLQLPFGTAMLAFAIILAGSLAAGILPAYKAITISAVDALREE